MIKFFRHIRKSLIAQNKMGKYFKYAIGEILLVVIGILIAFQINNWNQKQKANDYELKMLTEINEALESDIDYFKRLEGRLKRLDSSANSFLHLVHNKAIFDDSLYNKRHRWYQLRTGINLQFNDGPYEALKSSGLDKLSNDSLRNALIDFYDFRFPRRIAFIEFYDSRYEKNVETLLSFLSEPFTEAVDGRIEVYSKFPEDLFMNPRFLVFLDDVRSRASGCLNSIVSAIEEMQLMKNQIENVIND